MKFFIDAQLPQRFARILQSQGYEAYHTLDLPSQNRTSDQDIMKFADDHDCIVTTKDSDFVDSFYLQNRPNRLWLISTGNITNKELEQLVLANIAQVVSLFQSHRFLELSRTNLIIHL
ncbi:MAG: hypothetical protein OHK0022_31770 [Roseiflexaceae bacterium]